MVESSTLSITPSRATHIVPGSLSDTCFLAMGSEFLLGHKSFLGIAICKYFPLICTFLFIHLVFHRAKVVNYDEVQLMDFFLLRCHCCTLFHTAIFNPPPTDGFLKTLCCGCQHLRMVHPSLGHRDFLPKLIRVLCFSE